MMEENKVCISEARYSELVAAETGLSLILDIIRTDKDANVISKMEILEKLADLIVRNIWG